MDIGRKLADLERRLAAVEGSARLSHAAIDNTSVEVRDSSGSLRGLLGLDRKSTRQNSSHYRESRMPSSA